MNMHRSSITDLPNPAKRISELESELLRVRAALEDQHASTDALWNENTALRAALDECQSKSDGLFVHGQVTLAERNQARDEVEQAWAYSRQLGEKFKALSDELTEAYELDIKQHAAIVRDTLEIGELEADRDALRARLQAVTRLGIAIRDLGKKTSGNGDEWREIFVALGALENAAQRAAPLPDAATFDEWIRAFAKEHELDAQEVQWLSICWDDAQRAALPPQAGGEGETKGEMK